jgi:arylsulfatase A-like enzyme
VLIFLDDSGYGDFHPFGNPPYSTPNVERLARQGCQYTNFHVPQAICSASRSALMTGCYPERTKVFGAHPPRARGLDPKFQTMGQVLQTAGYKTAGFDESCGLMYSNDMWEFHPENPGAYAKFPLQFWENGQVKVERVTMEHQPFLTTWYTEHAVDFIDRHKKDPFLLYVPHSMPHVPLFVSKKYEGKSGAGLYGDVMQEIDWSIGQILDALHRNGLDQDTMVILTSDNGPWSSYGNHAGRTPFRDAKGTSFEGGTRSACIVKYPGKIRAGSVSHRAFCSIDLLPVAAHLAGAKLPEHPIDGRNVWDSMRGVKNAQNPQEFYFFTNNANFECVMTGDGRWKLHLPHAYRDLVKAGNDGVAGVYKQSKIERSLFDLESDRLESVNVLDKHPDIARRLTEAAERHRAEFYAEGGGS